MGVTAPSSVRLCFFLFDHALALLTSSCLPLAVGFAYNVARPRRTVCHEFHPSTIGRRQVAGGALSTPATSIGGGKQYRDNVNRYVITSFGYQYRACTRCTCIFRPGESLTRLGKNAVVEMKRIFNVMSRIHIREPSISTYP